ncbi:hypothetical protein E4U15_003631 [Claviceps sp. LM218 group G6]|nr:hypothetical protein E4U15_003631 [Claviceps sp. LM218 group G6]
MTVVSGRRLPVGVEAWNPLDERIIDEPVSSDCIIEEIAAILNPITPVDQDEEAEEEIFGIVEPPVTLQELLESVRKIRQHQREQKEPNPLDEEFYRQLDGYESRVYQKKIAALKQPSIKSFFSVPQAPK